MTQPVRLHRSRAAGFDLAAASAAANGLPYAIVDRSTIWGNPFGTQAGLHMTPDGRRAQVIVVASAEEAVERFRFTLLRGKKRMARLHELRGKNLVCWCNPGTVCHADVLLELANAPVCEEVT